MTRDFRGIVGERALGDSDEEKFRQGRTGEAIVSQLNGAYYERAGRGGIFTVANQAAVTTTIALATTYTGLCLTNDPSRLSGSWVDWEQSPTPRRLQQRPSGPQRLAQRERTPRLLR
jgi:hypothetical protein